MRMRIVLLALCLSLMSVSVSWAESAPSDKLFENAKTALVMLSEGDMDGALDRIGFDYSMPGDSDEAFKSFIAQFFPHITSTAVQQDVAVCYWEALSAHYLLAIPVTEPKSGDVMCLVLLTSDLSVFDGYAALTWSEVTDGTSQAEWVWWNVEYGQSAGSLYADR